MEEKYKKQFELINDSLWLLIKKYVKDINTYKNIMSGAFNLYMVMDKKKRFTEEWWNEAIEVMMSFPEKYKATEYRSFVGDLCIGFNDYWELAQHNKESYIEFYKCISKAFINEWERLKNEKEVKTKTT